MKAISFFIAGVLTAMMLAFTFAPQTNVHSEKSEKAELKSFSSPDEVREFPLGKLELVNIGMGSIGKATFQPGWRWSTSVQPLVNTKSCEAPHFQYHVSGTLKVKMDDGTLLECKPGDVSLLPHGHDAWVVGDEPVVVIDFQGMIDYAESNK
ncbi:MAG: cupin domain-containing protein [Chitinophagales bacterium]